MINQNRKAPSNRFYLLENPSDFFYFGKLFSLPSVLPVLKYPLLITKGCQVNLQSKVDFLYKGKEKQISMVHFIET